MCSFVLSYSIVFGSALSVAREAITYVIHWVMPVVCVCVCVCSDDNARQQAHLSENATLTDSVTAVTDDSDTQPTLKNHAVLVAALFGEFILHIPCRWLLSVMWGLPCFRLLVLVIPSLSFGRLSVYVAESVSLTQVVK